MKNLNVSFEASSFNNVKVIEINVLSTASQFLDCAFFVGKGLSSIVNAVNAFISINNTNITLLNSSFWGDFSISDENYKFFISERSRALFLNLNIKEINIGEVSDQKRGLNLKGRNINNV